VTGRRLLRGCGTKGPHTSPNVTGSDRGMRRVTFGPEPRCQELSVMGPKQ
jgi:hypothetical protein